MYRLVVVVPMDIDFVLGGKVYILFEYYCRTDLAIDRFEYYS
jgi:hypothetical protein